MHPRFRGPSQPDFEFHCRQSDTRQPYGISGPNAYPGPDWDVPGRNYGHPEPQYDYAGRNYGPPDCAGPNYDYMRPDYDRMAPDFDRMAPDFDRMAPNFDRMAPDFDRMTPDFDRVAPDFDRMSPTYSRMAQGYDFMGPDPDHMGSKFGLCGANLGLPEPNYGNAIPHCDTPEPQWDSATKHYGSSESDVLPRTKRPPYGLPRPLDIPAARGRGRGTPRRGLSQRKIKRTAKFFNKFDPPEEIKTDAPKNEVAKINDKPKTATEKKPATQKEELDKNVNEPSLSKEIKSDVQKKSGEKKMVESELSQNLKNTVPKETTAKSAGIPNTCSENNKGISEDKTEKKHDKQGIAGEVKNAAHKDEFKKVSGIPGTINKGISEDKTENMRDNKQGIAGEIKNDAHKDELKKKTEFSKPHIFKGAANTQSKVQCSEKKMPMKDFKPETKTEEEQLLCETCDTNYYLTQFLFAEHISRHVTCGRDGCKFEAIPVILDLHLAWVHEAGYATKISQLNSAENIGKWKQDRKKNFPRLRGVRRNKVEQALSGVTKNKVEQALSGVTKNKVEQALSGVTKNKVEQDLSGVTKNKVEQALSGVTRNKVEQATDDEIVVIGVKIGSQQGDAQSQLEIKDVHPGAPKKAERIDKKDSGDIAQQFMKPGKNNEKREKESPSGDRRGKHGSPRRHSRSPLRQNLSHKALSLRRSPMRRNRSRSPMHRKRSRSPVRRNRSRSPVRRNRSRSPLRRNRSRSPVRRNRSRSPVLRNRSPVRRNRSRSPVLRNSSPVRPNLSRSPLRRSRSPALRNRIRSPVLRNRSPMLRNRSPVLPNLSHSPLRRSQSPALRNRIRSPLRRNRSRSPVLWRRSPVHKRQSRSPVHRNRSPSPVQRNRSPLRRNRTPLQQNHSPHQSRSRSPLHTRQSLSSLRQKHSPSLPNRSNSPLLFTRRLLNESRSPTRKISEARVVKPGITESTKPKAYVKCLPVVTENKTDSPFNMQTDLFKSFAGLNQEWDTPNLQDFISSRSEEEPECSTSKMDLMSRLVALQVMKDSGGNNSSIQALKAQVFTDLEEELGDNFADKFEKFESQSSEPDRAISSRKMLELEDIARKYGFTIETGHSLHSSSGAQLKQAQGTTKASTAHASTSHASTSRASTAQARHSLINPMDARKAFPSIPGLDLLEDSAESMQLHQEEESASYFDPLPSINSHTKQSSAKDSLDSDQKMQIAQQLASILATTGQSEVSDALLNRLVQEAVGSKAAKSELQSPKRSFRVNPEGVHPESARNQEYYEGLSHHGHLLYQNVVDSENSSSSLQNSRSFPTASTYFTKNVTTGRPEQYEPTVQPMTHTGLRSVKDSAQFQHDRFDEWNRAEHLDSNPIIHLPYNSSHQPSSQSAAKDFVRYPNPATVNPRLPNEFAAYPQSQLFSHYQSASQYSGYSSQ